MRSAVVFPQPDGPTNTTNSPVPDLEVEAGDGFGSVGIDLRQTLRTISAMRISCGI